MVLKNIKDTSYYVSSNGSVKDKFKKNLKQYKRKGYQTVKLIINNENWEYFDVCRLVAEAFIDNPDKKPFIEHINKNKLDDNVKNLRWTDQPENVIVNEKYISITPQLHYRVRIPKLFIDKVFKTLVEAIEYRNNNLQK